MKELNLSIKKHAYINVMESLVAQEVSRQLQNVPVRVRRYLKLEEVVTYALNRLPALYASSEKGWQLQCQLAKRELQQKIQSAVRQAIAAVQVDPIRLSQPLTANQDQDAEAVLLVLRSLFEAPDLSWETALNKLKSLNGLPKSETESAQAQSSNTRWRPGSYGGVSWQSQRRQQATSPAAVAQEAAVAKGWDNVYYRL